MSSMLHAARQYMVSSKVKIWALCEPELSGEVEVGADHADKWETSLFMELEPELVQMDKCPDLATGKYLWTSPAALEASQKLGRKTVEWIVNQLGQGAERLLKS